MNIFHIIILMILSINVNSRKKTYFIFDYSNAIWKNNLITFLFDRFKTQMKY